MRGFPPSPAFTTIIANNSIPWPQRRRYSYLINYSVVLWIIAILWLRYLGGFCTVGNLTQIRSDVYLIKISLGDCIRRYMCMIWVDNICSIGNCWRNLKISCICDNIEIQRRKSYNIRLELFFCSLIYSYCAWLTGCELKRHTYI